ncbi:MAG: hypothetical protein IVW56_09640 [Candidatus Binataceae bacterium]|nr:hypothetical protein [Candidatus Binataceae bacterium]
MSITQDSLDLLKASLRNPNDDLAKSISTATGLVAYDLQAPAKNLYPFVTPIRNVMPRVGGGVGTATNWRQVNAIIGSGFDAMGWVPEGQRSGQMSYSTANKSATFVTIGEEDAATFEAISAGRDFEDIQARMTFRLLQKMMLKEEMAILAGNASLALGTVGTVTPSAIANAASTLPSATYYVQCVALTLEGWQNSSVATGVATTKTVTGVDGNTFTLKGGSSIASAISAGQAITAGTNMLAASVAPIQGAVAYAWYVGTTNTAGTPLLQAITTLNSATFSAPLTTGTQAASAASADNSANAAYAYDGLLTTALKPGSNAYVNTMATGTAGVGTPLTASGRGSINEIDTMFQTMWNNFELSPTVLYVNAQELKNITTKVLSNSSGPLLRYDRPADGTEGGEYQLTASGTIGFYYNPFAIYGGLRIPIKIHPRVPPGTIIGWAENLPIQYQSNEVPNVAELKTRQDYYQIDWPIVTRQRQVGVYAEEVLAVYAPFAMGVITNIANG